jgi:hypothetical protein
VMGHDVQDAWKIGTKRVAVAVPTI